MWNIFRRRGNAAAETRALEWVDLQWMALLGGRESAAGSVSRDAALMVAACSRAVRLIAETVATLPTVINRRLDGGGQERATDHPAYALIHDDANEWTSAYDLKLRVTIDALTHDRGGFGFINRDPSGRPVELLRIPPEAVTVRYGPGDEPTYTVQEAGGPRVLDRRDVIHVRSFGHVDKCPLTLATEAIGLALAQQRFAGRLMKNGAKPSSILSAKEPVGPEAMKKIIELIKLQATGETEGSTLALPQEFTFDQTGFSPEALELLDSRRFLIEEIGRAFGIPPHLLFEMGRATWGNAAEMGSAWLRFGLLPWLEVWHGAIRRTLLSPAERAEYVVETIVDDLTRADLAARMAAYSTAIAARVLNPNEARAMEGRPPFEGGDVFANPHTTIGGTPDGTAP